MKFLSFLNTKKKRNNKGFGNIGENIAKTFLITKGYKILATNFKCKCGEIDIIAQDCDIIAFIEVKTRSSSIFGLPEEAVNHIKQKHISKTAKVYIYKHKLHNNILRADIISIIADENNTDIKHIPNAFPLLP